MFDDKNKKNAMLVEELKKLKIENSNLKSKIESMKAVIEAAEKYSEEHRIAMQEIGVVKARYELAYKDMMKTKNEYEKQMNKLLKSLE